MGNGDVKNVQEMSFLFKKVDESIFEATKGSSIAEKCLEICLERANTLDNQLSILISTTIKRILTLFRDFRQPVTPKLAKSGINYVFKKWDSSIDVICYEAVDSFSLLLDIHLAECQKCKDRMNCEFRNDLIKNLFSSPSTCRSIFKCINLMAHSYPWLTLIDDEFVEKLYMNIGFPSLVVVISDIICCNLSISSCNEALHLDYIEKCFKSNNKAVKSSVMDRLVPNLVKKGHTSIISNLLNRLQASNDYSSHLEAVLSLVSMLIKASGGKVWSDFVSKDLLSHAILHCDSHVRLSAWNLLCIHPRISIPYTEIDLSLMRVYLITSSAEQSPAVRQKMLAAFKQILIRISETSEAILKKKGGDGIVKSYDGFLCDVMKQSFEALSPLANFNRRVFSLSLIDFVYRQNFLQSGGKRSFWIQSAVKNLIQGNQFEKLLGCLDDSFQLCQIMALDLLKHLDYFHFASKTLVEGFEEFLEETRRIMRSIRSHNSLTASYRYQFYVHRFPDRLTEILSEFLNDVEICLGSIDSKLIAITENPLHPTLAVLVSLLPRNPKILFDDYWKSFVNERLIPLCYRMATLVTPVVHSMAPEGYVPEEELSRLAGSSTTTQSDISQLLLVCCWRTHKHISEIFDWAIRYLYPFIISPQEIIIIGEYFWLQLTECRHCGAFESAVEGFTYLCQFLWRTSDPALPSPLQWLKRILKALEGGEDLDNLCSTRRSAGVPHLVVAILSSEPEDNENQALHLAADCLLNLENRDVKYRVHSLNVLKSIVHSSILKEQISFLLEATCFLAITGCSAQSWTERNASAQLAATLRTHIFGVTRSSQRDLYVDAKNRQSAYEFFSRFPSLYSVLYHQLENVKDEFSAFPTLVFLTHLYATNTVSKFQLAPFIPLCLKMILSCKAEKLRRLCAVAVISISQDEDIDLILKWLSEKKKQWDSFQGREGYFPQNHANSMLLLLQSILTIRPEYEDRVQKVFDQLQYCYYCEFNINLLQEVENQLSRREGYFSNFSDVVGTQKRILMAESFECISKYTEKFIRLEIYKWLADSEKLEITNHIDKLLFFVMDDIRKFELENEKLVAIKVLDKYMNGCVNKDELKKLIITERNKSRAILPEFDAVCWSFLSKLSTVSSEELILWAESTIDLEEDIPKEMAIELCVAGYMKEPLVEYLKVLVEMLQDEDPLIREKTATSVSLILLHKSFPLNPEVCRYLLLQKLPNEEKTLIKRHLEEKDSLFDACAVNVFAESVFFGDFSVIEKFLF